MKTFKFFLMALVLTFSLTITSFADSHVPHQNSKSVKIVKAEKATVVASDISASLDGFLVSDFTKDHSVASISIFGTEVKSSRNLQSGTRYINLINIDTESPPDKNFATAKRKYLLNPRKTLIGSFVKNAFVRRE